MAVLLATACGGDSPAPAPERIELTQPPPATAASTPQLSATDAPTPTATPESSVPEGPGYDPNRTMFRIWHGLDHAEETTLAALEQIIKHDDKSQALVILEALKFFRSWDTRFAAVETLTELTGQDFDLDRRRWREWIGPRREEYAVPSNYPRWKVDSMALIDPAIAAILEPGITRSRVDLTEVVWGGVRLDGIPPLEQAPYILAEQATWLWPDDRVFGVSINGEHRAYPLRIMNAHELANDVLGGEPISLVY